MPGAVIGSGPAFACFPRERKRFVDPRQGSARVLLLGFEFGAHAQLRVDDRRIVDSHFACTDRMMHRIRPRADLAFPFGVGHACRTVAEPRAGPTGVDRSKGEIERDSVLLTEFDERIRDPPDSFGVIAEDSEKRLMVERVGLGQDVCGFDRARDRLFDRLAYPSDLEVPICQGEIGRPGDTEVQAERNLTSRSRLGS